jgi:hypothetical protein
MRHQARAINPGEKLTVAIGLQYLQTGCDQAGNDVSFVTKQGSSAKGSYVIVVVSCIGAPGAVGQLEAREAIALAERVARSVA